MMFDFCNVYGNIKYMFNNNSWKICFDWFLRWFRKRQMVQINNLISTNSQQENKLFTLLCLKMLNQILFFTIILDDIFAFYNM